MTTPQTQFFLFSVTKTLAVLTCMVVFQGKSEAAKRLSGPGQETAPDNHAMIDLPVQAKVDTILAYVEALRRQVSNEDFFRIRQKCEILFSTSGYVSLETGDGRVLRLTKAEFLVRVRENRLRYELQQSTLLLNDRFQQDQTNRWFCRSTTFHAVSRFDRGSPVPVKVTSVQHKPVPQKAPTSSESYWQIIALSFKEI